MSRVTQVLGWSSRVLVASGILLLIPHATADDESPADLLPRSEARQQLEAALASRVDLEFIDTELGQALTFLSDRYQTHFLIDEPALTDMGLTASDPVNLNVSGIELHTALQLYLESRGLDLLIQDGVALVTSHDRVASTMETRVYPWNEADGVSAEQIAQVIRSSIRQDSWRAASTSGNDAAPWSNYDDTYYDDYASPEPASGLGDLMGGLGMAADGSSSTTAASPDPNVSHPAISALPGGLVITHCQPAHREITALLDQLRRLPATSTPSDSDLTIDEYESPFDTTTSPNPGLEDFPFTENFN
jgi:hypothetical protein